MVPFCCCYLHCCIHSWSTIVYFLLLFVIVAIPRLLFLFLTLLTSSSSSSLPLPLPLLTFATHCHLDITIILHTLPLLHPPFTAFTALISLSLSLRHFFFSYPLTFTILPIISLSPTLPLTHSHPLFTSIAYPSLPPPLFSLQPTPLPSLLPALPLSFIHFLLALSLSLFLIHNQPFTIHHTPFATLSLSVSLLSTPTLQHQQDAQLNFTQFNPQSFFVVLSLSLSPCPPSYSNP